MRRVGVAREAIDRIHAGICARRVAGESDPVRLVDLAARQPQVHRERAQQNGEAHERHAVLAPGDPGHPPPRQRRRACVLLQMNGHGPRRQRGHVVTSECSTSRPRAGPGSAEAPGSHR